MFKTLIATALLAATTSLYAQTPPPADSGKAAQRKEMREKMKSARDNARKACEGKKGDEHRACMRKEFCGQAKDPAKCEARVKERMDKKKESRQGEKK